MRGKSKVARQVPHGGEDDAAGTGEIDTTRRFCRAIVTAIAPYLNREEKETSANLRFAVTLIIRHERNATFCNMECGCEVKMRL
mmetsp:Transcript_998/g.2223  ORF Transcript_998/g.2223 Transcript_998/m.2223 type:complete len:84 (+) Transcript_998:2825-3076(+)